KRNIDGENGRVSGFVGKIEFEGRVRERLAHGAAGERVDGGSRGNFSGRSTLVAGVCVTRLVGASFFDSRVLTLGVWRPVQGNLRAFRARSSVRVGVGGIHKIQNRAG